MRNTKLFAKRVRDILKQYHQDANLISTFSDYEIGLWWYYTSGFLSPPQKNAPEIPLEEFDQQDLQKLLLLAGKVKQEVFRRAAERPPFTRADFEASIVNSLLGYVENQVNMYRIRVAGNFARMNETEFAEYYANERRKWLEDKILLKYDALKGEFGALEKQISAKGERLETILLAPIDWRALRFDKPAMWWRGIKQWREGLTIEAKLAVLREFQSIPTPMPLPSIKQSIRPPKKPLPRFEDALKEPDKLPGLWKQLAKMKNPLVSESGQFIWQGRPHAVLLAFAQAMIGKDKLHEKIAINDAYFILCARFNVPPTKSLRQVRRGKRDLIEHFEAFNDVLREG